MGMLALGLNDQTTVKTGDFGAQLVGKRLLVPKRLLEILDEADVDTGEQFLFFVSDFGEVLATQLGWDEHALRAARDRLLRLLEGVVRADVLEAVGAPLVRHAFGARE
jgi:hypothetical protein